LGDKIRTYGDTWEDDYLPGYGFTSNGMKINREKLNLAQD
jgi:hypothetical protein